MGRELGACVIGSIAALAPGCGRIGFDARADAGAADPDAMMDAVSAGTCWPAWQAHALSVEPPVRVAELSTVDEESNPYLAADDRTLYFNRLDVTRDLFVTTRAARGQAFGPAQLVPTLAEPGVSEGRLSLTEDGLLAVFASTRGGSSNELWQATRTTPNAAFGAPSNAAFGAVNLSGSEVDPDLTGDGLVVYFTNTLGATMERHPMVASRAARTDAFATPIPVPGIDPLANIADLALSPDQLVVVMSVEATSATTHDLFYATRASPTEPFGPAERVPLVNNDDPVNDAGAALSRDGCELWFNSNRTGLGDIYVARITPSSR